MSSVTSCLDIWFFIGWLDDLPAVCSLIYQIKYRNSYFVTSLYKRVCVCLQQVLPQMLECRKVGTVAAVHRSDSSSPQQSRESNMIPVASNAAQQSPSRLVTIFITSFSRCLPHCLQGWNYFLTFDRQTHTSKTATKSRSVISLAFLWFSFLIGGKYSSPAFVLDVLYTRRPDKVMGKII